MVNIFYRCGWCGIPTDKEGNVNPKEVSLSDMNKYIERNTLPEELVNGKCCLETEDWHPTQYVTREMAMDAGDLSLEGSKI